MTSLESDFDRVAQWGKKFLTDWQAGTGSGTDKARADRATWWRVSSVLVPWWPSR